MRADGADAGVARHGDFVPESRFGVWFLNTETWNHYVLKADLADLRRLMAHRNGPFPVVLDVGCGHGRSLPLLMEAFLPERLIGVEFESGILANARARAAEIGQAVTLIRGDCAQLPLRDSSVDMVFCHQVFHHLVNQQQSLREFHRVLRPNGLLLFAESTRAYTRSWIIRLLFRHPTQVQRSAESYLTILRANGFVVKADAISFPRFWWSLADLGLSERLPWIVPRRRGRYEARLLNAVAVKTQPPYSLA